MLYGQTIDNSCLLLEKNLFVLVTSNLDDLSLQSLLQTYSSLRTEVLSLVSNQHFFYLRFQHLICRDTQVSVNYDWKRAYCVLSSALQYEGSNVYTDEVLQDSFITSVLLELGYDPSLPDSYAIESCCELGCVGTLELILADKRADPRLNDNWSIRIAADCGNHAIIKLLLEDGRADPTCHDNSCFQSLFYSDNDLEVAKLFLEDGRVDPTDCDNYVLQCCVSNNAVGLVKLLLEDGRVDPTAGDNYAIKIASKNGYTKIVELLKTRSTFLT